MRDTVLVLNATYEVISMTKLGRALNLIISGDAILEEAVPDRFIRHANGKFPFPKIIRMLRYIKIPMFYEEQPWSKSGVIRRDKGICQYCGTKQSPMTIDHVHPRSQGGGNTWENTVAACFPCNNKKGHKSLKESGMVLKTSPRAPRRFEFFIK